MQYRMVRADVISYNPSTVFPKDSSGVLQIELGGGEVVRIGWSQTENSYTGESRTDLWWLDRPGGRGRTLLRRGDGMGMRHSCDGGMALAKRRLRDALRNGQLSVVGTDD
jgi:hypothetical protein